MWNVDKFRVERSKITFFIYSLSVPDRILSGQIKYVAQSFYSIALLKAIVREILLPGKLTIPW